jgi:quaternary ammonium compound-resistance protein SugE
MAWIVLIVAALIDVAMAVSPKFTDRWKRFWPSLPGPLFANAAVYLLTHSLKGLPVGTAFVVVH